MSDRTRSEHYRRSGVDIDAADRLIDAIKPMSRATSIPGAVGGIGGFGSVFDLAAAGYGASAPRLVSGTDGVGTKLKIAFAMNMHHTVGIDCVAMCVNDIIVSGAKPLFFLDYFATGRLNPAVGADVVAGIARGCELATCWLAGGETAEMPGMYADGEYDLAGFVVGALTSDDEILPAHASAGDVLVGLASTGVHSNGFSLLRRVLLDDAKLDLEAPLFDDEVSLGELLLTPTQIYTSAILAMRQVGARPTAMAHITGGGLWENPQRSLPDDLCATFSMASLRPMVQRIFGAVSDRGAVPESEMYRVFNMGVGMTVALRPSDVDTAIDALQRVGYDACVVGELSKREEAPVRLDGISSSPLRSP